MLNKPNRGKKGQLGGIQAGFFALMFMAVAIVVVVVINAFGGDFVEGQQAEFVTDTAGCNSTDVSSCGLGYNITGAGLVSLQTLADGTDDVTDVGIITIVLGLLVALIGIFGWVGYSKYMR